MVDVITMTFHQSDNYGAILQAYALQTKIKEMGYSTKILDYYSVGVGRWNEQVKINLKKISVKNIKESIWQFIIRKKRDNFEEFRCKLELTTKYSETTISSASNEGKIFIVGSDQVWNCDCTDGDLHYMLNFVQGNYRKNSYAASFGYDYISEKYEKKVRRLLFDFAKISVREKQGSVLVSKLINKEVPVVLDPVFLLDKVQWMKIMTPINKKYIFVYQAEKSTSLIQYAKLLARNKKLPIYVVSTVFKGSYGKNIKNYSASGPKLFLSLLNGADTVVTNSFHGTAFSILFHKDFYVEPLKNNNTNSRINNILEMLDLTERIIDEKFDKNITAKIDYSSVEKKIKQMKTNSIEYLENIIEEGLKQPQ